MKTRAIIVATVMLSVIGIITFVNSLQPQIYEKFSSENWLKYPPYSRSSYLYDAVGIICEKRRLNEIVKVLGDPDARCQEKSTLREILCYSIDYIEVPIIKHWDRLDDSDPDDLCIIVNDEGIVTDIVISGSIENWSQYLDNVPAEINLRSDVSILCKSYD